MKILNPALESFKFDPRAVSHEEHYNDTRNLYDIKQTQGLSLRQAIGEQELVNELY
ncbi:MAG: hypothetical protein WC498_03955 [Candidatus Saccharimonadales bacterium]